MSIKTSNNHIGIFCDHGPKNWQITQQGLLANKRLAVKDVFAVKNERNSAGNPHWFENAAPMLSTASCVEKLMLQGCNFQSFTHTDELAYSLEGNNIHYGAAQNPKLAGHACGGSSMGSAAAVAKDLADIGLGTDTGGSIRIPASYCGLFGIRPSHDVIAKDGLIPLAAPFDTIGWLTSSAELLKEVGDVLLPKQPIKPVNTLVIADELLELVDPSLEATLLNSLALTKKQFSKHKRFSVPSKQIFTELSDAFRVLQGRSIAHTYRDWLEQPKRLSHFAPAIQARFTMALSLTEQEEREAKKVQQHWQALVANNLDSKSCLFLPTTPTTAPLLGADTSALRMKIITLSAIAGLSRSAQVHIPMPCLANGALYGFSLMMSHGNDKSLLACIQLIHTQLK